MATVPASTRETSITLGSTTAGPFSVGFRLFEDEAISVFINGVETTDYTVSSAYVDGYDDSATVTLNTAQTSGTVIRIVGDMTIRRQEDLASSGYQLVDDLNVELGRMTVMIQDMERRRADGQDVALQRLVRFPPEDPDTLSPVLPAAASRANRIMAFDDNGNVTLTAGYPVIPLSTISQTYPTQQSGDLFAVERDSVVGKTTFADLKTQMVGTGTSVSVKAYGATGAGDDTAAFQAAIDALPASGGTIYLEDGADYTVTTAALAVGAKFVRWVGDATVNGAAYIDLPGISEAYYPNLSGDPRRIFYDATTGANSFVRYDFRRNADYSGGTTGVTSMMRVFSEVSSTVGTSGQTVSEWAFQARADNNSDLANVVANTGQVRRNANGSSWAGQFNAIDNINAETSSNAIWGFEANVQGDGPDGNVLRRVAGVVGHNVSQTYSGTPGTDEVGVGVEVYPHTADMNYGVRIRTLSGALTNTAGQFMEAALRIDAIAPSLLSAIHPNDTGVIRAGSRNTSGIVAQYLAVGNNSAAQSVAYADIRGEVDDATAGAEDGRLRFYARSGGAMTERLRLNPASGAPFQADFGGGLQPVTIGATDSGGVGFRVLRVPN